MPQTSQQRVKKIIKLEGNNEFLSNDQMPVQTNKSETTVVRAPDQRLRDIIEIQALQNIKNSQSTVANLLNAIHKVTEENTPRSEHNEKNTPRSVHNLTIPTPPHPRRPPYLSPKTSKISFKDRILEEVNSSILPPSIGPNTLIRPDA